MEPPSLQSLERLLLKLARRRLLLRSLTEEAECPQVEAPSLSRHSLPAQAEWEHRQLVAQILQVKEEIAELEVLLWLMEDSSKAHQNQWASAFKDSKD